MPSQLSSKQLHYSNHSVIEPQKTMNDDVAIISMRENNRVFNIDLESQSGSIRTLKTRTSSTTFCRALLGSRITTTKWSDWNIVSWDVPSSEDNPSVDIARFMEQYPSLHSNIQCKVVTKAELDAFENALDRNIAHISETYDPFKVFHQSIEDAGIRLSGSSICTIC